ncbi:TetR/AcrR family transcriptional regulator [Streptomyces carminius]|uniref:TetR/AcrR family transcriptional regulator n=1 Tax=Streptomyces carminius TaxID=2665496 RepID=UPI001E628BB8|nr:TetR/AcrR family transcriptional regulator [Streptomyces carminius]
MPPEGAAKPARRREPLTREAVLRTAVALADRDGVAALTMRRLAERLGVEAMSLYHHVANKDAILDGMVDAVFGEIELPAADGDWRTAMRLRAFSAREALKRHPWAVGLLDSRANPGPETLRHHEAVIGSLRAGGFSVAGAAHAFSVLDSYVYGFTLQELGLPFESTGDDLETLGAAMLERMPRDEFPHLTEMFLQHALRPGYAYADEFAVGLDLVLDGLDRCRETWR